MDALDVILFCVLACKFLAVERAFVNAFLDNPNDTDVPYLAASNMASKNIEEQRKDTLVASDTAVTILAIFSESKVPSIALFISCMLLVAVDGVNCPAIINQKCIKKKERERKGKWREGKWKEREEN